MTCVVGLAEKGKVYIGVDSASVQGWTRRTTNLRKVFRTGPFLIGYTTSFRMGQILEHHLVVPPQDPKEANRSYMVTKFAECVRAMLREKGFSKVEANSESGGQFLVGYRGTLYSVQSDYQVGEMSDGLDTVGSGAEIALGAAKALEKVPAVRRIRRALEISAQFNMGVCAPFHIKSMKG